MSLPEDDKRRTEADRRGDDRRRSARGLFEIRARRDQRADGRRQEERRSARSLFTFWRRRST